MKRSSSWPFPLEGKAAILFPAGFLQHPRNLIRLSLASGLHVHSSSFLFSPRLLTVSPATGKQEDILDKAIRDSVTPGSLMFSAGCSARKDILFSANSRSKDTLDFKNLFRGYKIFEIFIGRLDETLRWKASNVRKPARFFLGKFRKKSQTPPQRTPPAQAKIENSTNFQKF